MHFVLNCVCVFPRVFSVSQCIDFLLKDTIMYIFIDWEIKGTPFYSRTETGDYVRVSMWLLCGTIFNDRR